MNKLTLCLCVMLALAARAGTNTVLLVDTNWFAAVETTYYSTNTWSSVLSWATAMTAGPVTIDCETGEVTIREGVTMTEASREFWKAVAKAYPEMFKDKEKVKQ